MSGLPWAPPTLTSPTVLNPTNGASNFNGTMLAGQDYIVQMPGTPLTSPLVLATARHVRIIGGEINIATVDLTAGAVPSDHYALYLIDLTGTIHVEGMYLHGAGCAQGITYSMGSPGPNAVVQVQNCRIETLHPVTTWIHTDGQQSWAGPHILKQYKVSTYSVGTAMQMQPNQLSAVGLGQWEYHFLDWTAQQPDSDPSPQSYGLWKNSNPTKWAEYHRGIYYHYNANHVKAAAPVYSTWSDGNNHADWNPGNPDGWPITGEQISLGSRPGGDLVPAARVGIGYVSPGYGGGGALPMLGMGG